MSELSQLSPQPLWDIFAKICSIPHPSYHEEQLAEHILSWAQEKGFHPDSQTRYRRNGKPQAGRSASAPGYGPAEK